MHSCIHAFMRLPSFFGDAHGCPHPLDRAGSDLLSSPFPQHRISFAFFSTLFFSLKCLSSFFFLLYFLAPNHEKRGAAFSGFPRKKTQQVKNTRKKRGEPARRGTKVTTNTTSDDADERTRRSKRLRTYDCTGTDTGTGRCPLESTATNDNDNADDDPNEGRGRGNKLVVVLSDQ